jgi:hypothetical protein
MRWFNFSDQYVINYNNHQLTPQKSKYFEIPYQELTLTEEVTIGNIPTLVRVNLPHDIVLNGKPRWAISLRIQFKSNCWSDTVEFMRPYFKS